MYEPQHLKRWTLPDSYFGAEWPEYFVAYGQHRDSDALTRSNFRSMLAALGGESETVLVIRESHWAVGWVEWIGVHQSDDKALEVADHILERLEDYPVVSEDDWTELESEEADQVWRDCYRPSERVAYVRKRRDQFDFSDYRDLIGCIRGRYFAGYASELLA